jgi:asparagine synthase (glutamine-hydrolysing)
VRIRSLIHSHKLLSHRGRDDEGFYVLDDSGGHVLCGADTVSEMGHLPRVENFEWAHAALGHRRLSIIDLSVNGHQPMRSASGRYVIVYNGEIYNYLELRKELALRGHRFETESDTEVLLACLEEWGIDCQTKLNGMWAFAVIDEQESRLLLARDRLGIKPMYYTIVSGTLHFASEAKALLPLLPAVKMNEQRVVEYLVSNYIDHHEQTVFEGIHQLMPGHYAIWAEKELKIRRYWDLPQVRSSESLGEATDSLAELLASAVDLRLRSDVPVGTLLSGGLDSTTIACLISRRRQPDRASAGYDAFSAVFEEESFSEKKYIEDTIDQTKLPIHWIFPRADMVESELRDLLYYQDFPFRSLSTFSQWIIMREIEKTPIKVLLNGQGSDEIFAGYTQHYYALAVQYFGRFELRNGWQLLSFLRTQRGVAPRTIARNLAANVQMALLNGRRSVLSSPDYLNQRYKADVILPAADGLLDRRLAQNLMVTALPEYLRYEDRNSMAYTLESRLPFLDYRLVEWAMTLPADYKISTGSSKHVLREAARPLIPASVADRQDKMGFVSPQEVWQRNALRPLLDDAFKEDLQSYFPFLNAKRVRERYQRYQEKSENDWAWVWRVACLYWWHKTWWD